MVVTVLLLYCRFGFARGHEEPGGSDCTVIIYIVGLGSHGDIRNLLVVVTVLLYCRFGFTRGHEEPGGSDCIVIIL